MNSAISLSIAPSFAALDTHIGVGTENLNSENTNIVRYLQRQKITKRESAGAHFCVSERGQVSVREAGRARDTDGGVHPPLRSAPA